jgi:hypothetical protein
VGVFVSGLTDMMRSDSVFWPKSANMVAICQNVIGGLKSHRWLVCQSVSSKPRTGLSISVGTSGCLSRFCEMTPRFLQRQQRQDLNGFAEPHIVGQHTSEATLAEQIEPCDALRLIRPEFGAKARRQIRMGQPAPLQQTGEATKIIGALESEVLVLESQQRHNIRAREP